MDNPFKSPAILSFCPGILGLERGIKRVIGKLNVVAYVEIEAFIIANMVAGMEAGLVDPAPIWTDAKTFDARPFRGKIHGIIGGYPCTPFSLAGTRSGENHPGHIYPVISRAIEATGPIWCFFENVDDHLSLGFDKVYQDLHRMGYTVETGIYTAEEVGAPHERERMFIFALENSYCRRLREAMANPNSSSTIRGLGNIFQAGSEDEREAREWQRSRDEFKDSSKILVDTTSIPEREQADQTNAESTEEQARKESAERYEQLADFVGQGLEGLWLRNCCAEQEFALLAGCSNHQFPAGRGEEQHEWEESRTIEPGMGCTIDGYNFREDLLRALGNSVVEQTAELAFKDLLNKHWNNLK